MRARAALLAILFLSVGLLSFGASSNALAASCAFINDYSETGKTDTCTWTINLAADEIAIVGGFSATDSDGSYYTNGFYAGYGGPGTLSVSVFNGFVKVVPANQGAAEWCFRLDQTHSVPASLGEPDWAHAKELPLPGWSCNGALPLVYSAPAPSPPPPEPVIIYVPVPAPPMRTDCNSIRGTQYWSEEERTYYKTTCEPIYREQERQAIAAAQKQQLAGGQQSSGGKPTINGRGREQTGQGGFRSFVPSDWVNGTICLGEFRVDGSCTGAKSTNSPCLYKATVGGTVYEGVRNPWVGERIDKECQFGNAAPPQPGAAPAPAPAPPTGNCERGENGLCRHGGTFAVGEAVTGHITIDGKDYGGPRGCYIASATKPGTIRSGIANPRADEKSPDPCPVS